MDKELLGLIEEEVRELLTKYGYKGDKVTIVEGSALKGLKGDPDGSEERIILSFVVNIHGRKMILNTSSFFRQLSLYALTFTLSFIPDQCGYS